MSTTIDTCKRFRVGERIRVIEAAHNQMRAAYPYYPDLAGKVGTVKSIQNTFADITELDFPIVHVEFETFKVGVIPDGEMAYGYTPTEFRDETIWAFCLPDEIEHYVEENRASTGVEDPSRKG